MPAKITPAQLVTENLADALRHIKEAGAGISTAINGLMMQGQPADAARGFDVARWLVSAQEDLQDWIADLGPGDEGADKETTE